MKLGILALIKEARGRGRLDSEGHWPEDFLCKPALEEPCRHVIVFGCFVVRRLVKTVTQQVVESKFVSDLPECKNTNRVVGVGGSVCCGCSDKSGEAVWHLLGFVTNETLSAIFRKSNIFVKKGNYVGYRES
uniref:Uncharacterized protein n=1 Tax=Salvator merianae TaxID=96440 RepID=A0A8D0KJE0_SALMN